MDVTQYHKDRVSHIDRAPWVCTSQPLHHQSEPTLCSKFLDQAHHQLGTSLIPGVEARNGVYSLRVLELVDEITLVLYGFFCITHTGILAELL
jgi:hypothetical protein